MIPVLFRVPDWVPLVGSQPVTSFGVALLAAFLAGGALFDRRLSRRAPAARPWELVVLAAIGGLVGAKLMHLGIHAALGIPGGGLGRGGLDWFGGLIGGGAVVLWKARADGIPASAIAAAAAPALALGYALGRLGSFLVGADYGHPTTLPWGVTFPAGTPPTTPPNLMVYFGLETPPGALAGDYARVHPTPLYEAALSLLILAVLEWRRRRPAPGRTAQGWHLLGIFLILSGSARAAVELVRAKQDVLFGAITVDSLLALGTAALGVMLIVKDRAGDASEPQ